MWLVPLVVIGVIVLVLASMFNSLVGKKNQVKNVFASTDALLKKRYDLLPNLIAAVKGYMQHERALLEEITQLRAKALADNTPDNDKVELDNKISNSLSDVMIAVENYPDLKANENFLHLQRTLVELEEQISAGRRAFNASVTDYNNAVEMFPTNILASMINYKRKSFFEISAEQRENIDAGKHLRS